MKYQGEIQGGKSHSSRFLHLGIKTSISKRNTTHHSKNLSICSFSLHISVRLLLEVAKTIVILIQERKCRNLNAKQTP